MLDDEGEVLARAPGFEEALLVVDLDPSEAIGRRLRDVRRRSLAREREDERGPLSSSSGAGGGAPEKIGGPIVPFEPELEQMRRGLVLALHDYVDKNGFGEIVLGLSGGIDSALVAALAVDALGPDKVHCVSMPSRYSSEGTRPTRGGSRRAWAATSARSRSRRSSPRSTRRSAGSKGWRRRTCRRGSAARC